MRCFGGRTLRITARPSSSACSSSLNTSHERPFVPRHLEIGRWVHNVPLPDSARHIRDAHTGQNASPQSLCGSSLGGNRETRGSMSGVSAADFESLRALGLSLLVAGGMAFAFLAMLRTRVGGIGFFLLG